MGVILALITLKGGSGKTTCAVHLAAALTRRRGAGRVVLIDGDPHESATRWAARSSTPLPFEVLPVNAYTGGADHVVVDTAAGEAHEDLVSLAERAHAVIVPARPVALDLVATLDVLRLLAPASRPRVLLTQCPPAPQRDASEARALIEGQGYDVLRTEVPARKAYQSAALDGVTVREVPRVGATLWPAWPRILREVKP